MTKPKAESREPRAISRRELLAGAALTAGATLIPELQGPQQGAPKPPPAAPPPTAPDDPSAMPGAPTSAQSPRSAFENPMRTPTGAQAGSSLTPLHQLTGTMTPNDVMFERHHSGVPTIDPAKHKLIIHGMVDRPLTFTLADLKRLPSVSRVHFLECSGNGRAAYKSPTPQMNAQITDGLTCNGEWTGVPLATVLREAGVQRSASWFFAEGNDSAKMSRSIPIDKAWDDALLVWAFNGEPLRPSNGYPLRLFLPGFEGNTCVKWLRRIKLTDQPNMSKDETSKYTDPLPGGKARQFSFLMDAKSVITSPNTPAQLERGWCEISGIAWSGRGKIQRVDVSTDGGASWQQATLHGPVLSKAHTRFTMMWNWSGGASILMSRATDDTGYTQPTRAVFEATRGKGTDYHYNHIRGWQVDASGAVTFAGAA
jgi:sulfane dehydrogenase subunit SoxC